MHTLLGGGENYEVGHQILKHLSVNLNQFESEMLRQKVWDKERGG